MKLPWRTPPNPAMTYDTYDPGPGQTPTPPPFTFEQERVLLLTAQPGDVKIKIMQDGHDLYVHLRNKTDKAEIKLTFDQWQELERVVMSGIIEFSTIVRYS